MLKTTSRCPIEVAGTQTPCTFEMGMVGPRAQTSEMEVAVGHVVALRRAGGPAANKESPPTVTTAKCSHGGTRCQSLALPSGKLHAPFLISPSLGLEGTIALTGERKSLGNVIGVLGHSRACDHLQLCPQRRVGSLRSTSESSVGPAAALSRPG